MADQIQIAHSVSGANVYALIRNVEGDVWDDVGSAFVPYATVDLDDYDLPMTEQGTASRYYAVDMPATPAGLYSIVAFVRAGGSPAETDTAIGAADADWSGVGFGTASAVWEADPDDYQTSGTFGALLEQLKTSLNNVVSLIGAPITTVAGDIVTVLNVVNVLDGRTSGIGSLRKWLQLMFRKDAAITTDAADELAEINADEGSGPGAYDNITDSLEAHAAAVASVKAKTDTLPDGITKNQALANFTFFMASSTDHVTGATGLTVTATRSLDGAAFAACANAVSAIGGGWYKISLAAGDLNGDIVALLFSATGADARALTIKTEA